MMHCDKTVIDENALAESGSQGDCLWPLEQKQYCGQLFVAFTAAASICVNTSLGFLSLFSVDSIRGLSLYKLHLVCAGTLALSNLAAGSVASWYAYDEKYLPTVGCQFYTQWVVSTISAFINFILYTFDSLYRAVVLLKR
uniref:G-protein coupled receptors family 1 profile domain-containing protein n=1 Tax=Trichuris muris TaxID=70415 RepID=A0A5S6QD76_TRIMR